MKSFGIYISKLLISFAGFMLILLFINAAASGVIFIKTYEEDYGETPLREMLEIAAGTVTPSGIPEETAQKLRQDNVWAICMDQNGQHLWSMDLPKEIPQSYTIQDIASFSRGYIADYPVFALNVDNGLLVLGYPKDSYAKLTNNYYSIRANKKLPFYIMGMLSFDLLSLFLAYYFSRRKIIRNTGPIVAAVETLSDGRPISLHVRGELSEVADSVNRTSQLLSRQNEARANWISGVSHDIRTPLSMIMGYAQRIAADTSADSSIREQAEIVRKQSVKIKELVQDLNLVSQLEYEMQPLHTEQVRLSKLLRSYTAELLNTGISDAYTIAVESAPCAETAVLECDARLISRAVNNLVQNSLRHNPQGCDIRLILENTDNALSLSVADNGIGLSAQKLRELENKPHYMESTDERLDLRHGLGLFIVRQIAAAHQGTLEVKNTPPHGCRATMRFAVNKE